LHLHPGDLALIEEEGADLPWPLQPDDDVERGGLRFVSAEGEMSDTPADWRRAIAAAVRS
jgi:flagellar assembly protein FliH